MSDEQEVEIGEGFSYVFFAFDPDRDLNPQYENVPNVDRAGVSIKRNGETVGACWFDTPETRAIPWTEERKFWTLVSEEPLHIEPSIQMYRWDPATKTHIPTHHGYIRGDQWVWA